MSMIPFIVVSCVDARPWFTLH